MRQEPGCKSPSEDIVGELRARALSFTVIADMIHDGDRNAAGVLREEAVQLQCHAAVVAALSELHDEMGRHARWWDQFVQRLGKNR